MIVYRLSLLLRSVGHRDEPHKNTPAVGNERGDIEIKDYVILPPGEDDRFPPHTLVMDVTMTHDRYVRTTQRTNEELTHISSSTGAPQSDDTLNNAVRIKVRHYRQIYTDRPDPIVFLPVVMSTSGRVYDDFSRLLFLHSHREASILAGELPTSASQVMPSTCQNTSSYVSIRGNTSANERSDRKSITSGMLVLSLLSGYVSL